MTFKVSGHVAALRQYANGTHLEVVVQLESESAGGAELTLRMPREEAAKWLPGTVIAFTLAAVGKS